MKVALIVSESSVNPVKCASGAAVLRELRNRSIECSLVIVVRNSSAFRRLFRERTRAKLIQKLFLWFSRKFKKSPNSNSPPKRVTPSSVFHWFEKLLGSQNVRLYQKELTEFINSNPERTLIIDSLDDPKFLAKLGKHHVDLAVVKGGGILRKDFLKHFKKGVINLHGSGLLPYYRGLGSLEFALIDEQPIYMNIHLVDTGIDTGPILLQKELQLRGSETLAEIYGRLNAFSVGIIVDAVEAISSNSLVPVPQKLEAGRQHFLPHPLLEDYTLRKLRKRLPRNKLQVSK